jgi:hypothetical protein
MLHSVYNIKYRAKEEFYSHYNPIAHRCPSLSFCEAKIFWDYIIINIYKISLDDKSDFLIIHRKLRTVLNEIREYVSTMKQGAENFYMKTNLKMNPKLIALDNKPLFYF